MRQLLTIFFSVLIAETGDKTQLATLLFAADGNTGKVGVFVAAGAALLVSTLLAVVVGGWIGRMIPPATLKMVSGVGFILIGIWTMVTAGR